MRASQGRYLFGSRRRKVAVPPPKEDAMQIQLVEMLGWCLRPDVFCFHVPNGGSRDPREAGKLKAMGTRAGVADLQFHWATWDMRVLRDVTPESTVVGKVRKVLWMELKVEKRDQNDAQVAFELAMRLLGDEYVVVRSIDEAITMLGTRGLLRSDVEVCGRRWNNPEVNS